MPYAWSSAHSSSLDGSRDRVIVEEALGVFALVHAGSTYGEAGTLLDDIARLLPALLGQRRREGHELDGNDLADVLDGIRQHIHARLRDEERLAAASIELAALLWPEMSSDLWIGHLGGIRAVRVHDGRGEAMFAPDTLIELQIAHGVLKRHEATRVIGPRSIVTSAWSLASRDAPARLTAGAVALEDVIALIAGSLHDDPDLGPWVVADRVRDVGPARGARALVSGETSRGVVLVVQQVP